MFDFQQGGTILEKYLPILRKSPFFKGLSDNEILIFSELEILQK